MTPPSLQHELGKRRPFERPEQEAYLNLLRTCSLFAHRTERVFRTEGLSEPTYNTLRIIRGHRQAAADAGETFPGLPCSVISGQLVTPVPDLTRLVDRLVRDGFAKRRRSETDRRVVYIDITAKGLKAVERLETPLQDLNHEHLGHLTERELKSLNRLLTKARAPLTARTPS